MPGHRIDRDALHRLLFRRADRLGRCKLALKDLAAELDLGYCNLSVVINSFVREGRMRYLSGHQPKMYVVVDPELWKADDES